MTKTRRIGESGAALQHIGDAYRCFQSATIEHVYVDHAGFRHYCAGVGRFLRGLRDNDDEYWTPLVRHLQRFKYDLASAQTAFQMVGQICADRQHAARSRYKHGERLYGDLGGLANELLDLVDALSASPDAPLKDALIASLEPHDGKTNALLVSESRLIPFVSRELEAVPTLRELSILSAQQLRAPRCYERLYLVGSGRAFPDYVFAAPRATLIRAIHFRWLPPLRPRRNLFAASDARLGSPAPAQSATVIEPVPDDANQTIEELNDWQWYAGAGLSKFAESVSARHAVQRHEAIRALPVALEGGLAVLLDAEDGSSTLVIDLQERDKGRVRRVATADVEEGMFVLVRAGGGGDLIVPVADALLKDRAGECRSLQKEWKTRLRERIRAKSLFEVSIALLDLGSTRANESNVRNWAWDRSIRTEDIADFRAILRLVGLEGDTDRYWDAMSLIDSAHTKAGQAIRKLLLERVRSTDASELERLGAMEFDLPGQHAGKMIAARVLKVADQPVLVHPSEVGRPFEAA